MSKSSYFIGQPVYRQVLNLMDKSKIIKISRKTPGSEDYVKHFDGWSHLIVMLYGILRHINSLRDLADMIETEINKYNHLGLDHMVKRSTLADANKRRPAKFFESVYFNLLKQYTPFLADTCPKRERKDWEKSLYMIDSTTVSLFSNIFKGVGRHPKKGKKKGGIKIHTMLKEDEGIPMVVDLTSAATHDHFLLKDVHLPKDSTIAMDRAYIDYAQFQRLTEEGVCYVTKMKKNLVYKVLDSTTYVSPKGLVAYKDQRILFEKGEIHHEARKVTIWYEDKKNNPVELLTNNFDFTVEDIEEIYKRRWAIEVVYKKIKQNFPLHFFYGESANAIQVQIWVVLIANLLCTVLQRMVKRHVSFSRVVSFVGLMLMYYVDVVTFLEAPGRDEKLLNKNGSKGCKSPPTELPLFDDF